MAILCGTDFSEQSTRALTAAAHLAARMRAPLHVLHSIEASDDDAESVEPLRNTVAGRLEIKAERLRGIAAQVVVHVRVGSPDESLLAVAREFDNQTHILESREPALAISQAAERLGVDAICLGTRGRSGLIRAVLGSVAQAVLARSERPVMLVHQPRD